MKGRRCVLCIPLGLLQTAPYQRAIGVLHPIFAYQRNDFGWLSRKLVRQLFVVRYQVCYIDVAVELLHQDVLANLVAAIMIDQPLHQT